MKLNRKITDYFPVRHHHMHVTPLSPISKNHNNAQPNNNSISQVTRSPGSPDDNKSNKGNDEALREENRVLRDRLK